MTEELILENEYELWPTSKFGEPSRPNHSVKVPAGFKVQDLKTWWAQNWVEIILELQPGIRMQRGLYYANLGQVASINVSSGIVTAQVQGTGAAPYTVRIWVKTLRDDQLAHLVPQLQRRNDLLIAILSQILPVELESMLESHSASLFPRAASELQMKCSCPDWANPCKHIAAVHLILAAEMDRDPGVLLKLRGLDLSNLLEFIQTGLDDSAREIANAEESEQRLDIAVVDCSATPATEKDSAVDARAFWQYTPEKLNFEAPNLAHSELLQTLGQFPFWQCDHDFLQAMTAIYQTVSITPVWNKRTKD